MKKIGLLALALVLALGTLGVAYAMWSDTVTITGTVGTGNLILGVADTGTDDPDDGTTDPQCGNGIDAEPKDVANFESVNGATKCIIDTTQYYADITETFNHVYPWYGPTVTCEIANCGTVPLKITGMAVTSFTGTDLTPWMSFSWIITDEDGYATPGSGTWDEFVAALGTPQIRGGGHITIEKTICFNELVSGGSQDNPNDVLPQNASMSYTLTVTGAQWNEVP